MIVVTTPTGAIGRQVLHRLLDDGHREPVRVVVRDPARLPAEVRDRVEVVAGSHGDPAVTDAAFDGADAVFWLVPPDLAAPGPDVAYLDFTRPACAALRRHGVPRVVGVSALGRGTPQAAHAGLVTASLAMDDLIAGAGVHYRALALPSFMDNLLRQVATIRDQGVLYGPLAGDLAAPMCATRDIAAVAARLLLDRTWTGVDSVAVLGPRDVTFDDAARVMSEVLGRPVRYQRIPADAFRAGVLARGASAPMAQAMLDMMLAKDAGLDNAEPRTPAATTPTTLRQWCEEVLKPAVEAPAR
ncbi:NAD(P)H-binding protein [Dactylosporangium aurantiacum]|uniref:NAD(P)H-binding protein n=1 Tax=Dactylosporangium aurantiacum TaxID=35754 RepID=A0A9Q9IBG7_9ACTN|nr:NAD(P)H-binding protein [Dactylosporangium aurantiacum]MDG6101451.1 NAD(P)H-binding protein [Dactylosporangium aurantiacum]UWZ52696.1 NAD(P)H-binding protein [Dactylosporangium aurantiacum]